MKKKNGNKNRHVYNHDYVFDAYYNFNYGFTN